MWETIQVIERQLNNLAGAVLVLLVGLILGLIVKKLLRKILKEIEVDKIAEKVGKNYELERRLSGMAAYIIYFISLVWALRLLGITSLVVYVILGIVLLLVGGTVLLRLKDVLPNLLAKIKTNKKYRVGKKIRINEIVGIIEKAGWLEMEIRTKKGDKIYIPNSLLVKSKVSLLH